jgi:TolB protein
MRTLLLLGLLLASIPQSSGPIGLFTHSGDVGAPINKGTAVFDAATGEYRITGSGANMWAKDDQFQYVWKEMTGNFTVTATVRFLGQGAAHRKAGIVLRQSLDADATYADVVVHGDGMPSLQWRPRKGEDTNTFNLPFDGPGTHTIKLQRQGARIYMSIGKNGAEVKEIGHAEVTFQAQAPILVGLGVCSHDANASDTAIFSNVSIVQATPAPPKKAE